MTPYVINGRIRNRKLTCTYIENCLQYLKIHRFKTKFIEITFSNDIDGALGLCHYDDCGVEVHIARICPDTGRMLTWCEMMKTLGHELIHAKQFLRKQLTYDHGLVWKGITPVDVDYDHTPWELEAYLIEDELFFKCYPNK